MAEYEMQTLNLPNEEGEEILFPRMKLWGQIDLDYLASRINHGSTFTHGDIIGITKALTEAIAHEMGQGFSVKIDGLGVFSPALGLREGFERESGEEGGHKRNAASICVKNINFRADKEFIYETGNHCTLNRSEWKFQRSSKHYTAEQRLKMAQDYLKTHPLLKVTDYCELTGLLRNAAARELKQWTEMPETGIDYTGRGSHKVYITRLPASPQSPATQQQPPPP